MTRLPVATELRIVAIDLVRESQTVFDEEDPLFVPPAVQAFRDMKTALADQMNEWADRLDAGEEL